MTKRITIVTISIYLIGFFLTYGYLWHRYADDPLNQVAGSLFGSMGWPIYWLGRAAIEITQGWSF